MVSYKTRQLSAWLDMVSWDGIKENDDVQAWSQGGTQATIEVIGDATVDIIGNILGDKWFALNDADLMPVSFSRPGIKTCHDMFISIKPKKTGPGEATVAMIIRR